MENGHANVFHNLFIVFGDVSGNADYPSARIVFAVDSGFYDGVHGSSLYEIRCSQNCERDRRSKVELEEMAVSSRISKIVLGK